MRTKASKILVLLLLCLLTLSAYAKPHKRAPMQRSSRVAPRSPGHSTANKRATKSLRRPSSKHIYRVAPAETHKVASVPPTRERSQDEVHVRHNRKPHTKASPDVPPNAYGKVSVKKESSSELPTDAADQAVAATVPPAPLNPTWLVHRGGRLVVPPALKGSREILMHQNEMADRDGLDRIQDDGDLERLRTRKSLVALPSGAGIQTDERLPANRRYCRPWTAQFLAALGRAHYARFERALQVNSAVRTVEFQQRLVLRNGNAAPAGGETASPHLTGQAVDLAKHGLSLTEIAWLRGYLLPLVQEGKIDVEEEFQQACFHISVYRGYLQQPATERTIAGQRGGTATALAAAVR